MVTLLGSPGNELGAVKVRVTVTLTRATRCAGLVHAVGKHEFGGVVAVKVPVSPAHSQNVAMVAAGPVDILFDERTVVIAESMFAVWPDLGMLWAP